MRNFIFHIISPLILKALWTPSFTACGFHLSPRIFALLDFDTQPCKAHSTAFIYARALDDYIKCRIQPSQEPTFSLSIWNSILAFRRYIEIELLLYSPSNFFSEAIRILAGTGYFPAYQMQFCRMSEKVEKTPVQSLLREMKAQKIIWRDKNAEIQLRAWFETRIRILCIGLE